MATTPFTGAFVNRLENRTHAYRFTCITGEVVQFKYFCCDEPYAHDVVKTPVVIAIVDPDIACIGDPISVDIRTSYMPLGTLDTYEIDWGDGTGTGVLAWPPGAATVKGAGYAAAGTYDIRIEVTETLAPAITGNLTVQVLIVDCDDERILADYMYALSTTTGPWLRDMTVLEDVPPAVPAWVQHINGLPAAWLVGRDLKTDPHRRHLPVAGRHVWIATQAGVAKSTDNMDHWFQLYNVMPEPRNTAGDIAPNIPTKANLDWVAITFNPLVRDEVYILAYDPTIAPDRSFVYFTHDGGITWDNWEVAY